MHFYRFIFFVLVICCLASPLLGEEFSILNKTNIITFESEKSVYDLGYDHIINNSERVSYQDTLLIKGADYTLNYIKGTIFMQKQIEPSQRIKVSFKVFPKSLVYSFQKFLPLDRIPKTQTDKQKTKEFQQQYDTQTNLNISGSKSFALSLGNKQDMDLDQSLYLQVDGELSKNIFLKAQLSDNTTPISTEGTTKKLSEFDKMFIKVYSGNYSLQFGDFFTRFDDTYYANYDFKLEGVTFNWTSAQKVNVSAAVSNGDFKSYSFYGTEGIQGPYYLPGKNSSSVRVLSGTDKIYLNGSLLTRGNDYFIDYNEGSITFQNNNIITEESYIIADYEYTAEEYRSNFYLGAGELAFFDNGLNLSLKIVSNNDDKDNPLNFSLTDEEKQILKEAGNDPEKARISGVDSVAVGDGNYILADSHYVYVGFDSTGNYLVSFSYVGSGKGTYNKSGYISYEWVGEGKGEYIPEIQLPFPEKRTNVDMRAQLELGSFEIVSEGMLTNYDQNSFSPIDDDHNNGFAHYHSLNLELPFFLQGKAKTSVYYRAHDKYFHSLARVESAETQYQTSDFVETDTVDVTEYGGSVDMSMPRWISNRVRFYEKYMKDVAHQQTFSNSFSYSQNPAFPILPSMRYTFSQITQESDSTLSTADEKLIQRTHSVDGDYAIGFIKLKAGFSDKMFENDGILDFGFRTTKYFYGFTSNFWNTEFTLGYEHEFVDSLKIDWFDYKKAQLYKAGISYIQGTTNFKIEYSHRENKYLTGASNTNFDLMNSQLSFDMIKNTISNRVNYKIGNLELYPKVKELIYVGDGNGLYDSLGFHQEDGDYDYEITIVGTPEPITELQMNWNLQIHPSRGISEKSYGLNSFLDKIILTSDVAIQEKSSTPHKLDLYLLKPSALMNKKYTDYGYQRYKEQLWYNIKKNKIVLRFLYEKTKKIDNQYENEFDELDQDSYTAALNFYKVRQWNFENEVKYTDVISNYQTADFLNSKVWGFSTDISYKFGYNMIISSEFALDCENGAKLDGTDDYTITSYTVEPEFVYNAGSKYHFTAQVHLQQNERKGSDYFANILYSKRAGLNSRVTFQFDYKFSKYVTGFLKYYLEKYPKSDARYQLKMEVRADF
ncbi:MAG: hypothetical protein JW794_03990 [Candidatus Cloacimonetes bacterium]|nr:hypothetical protein [Candidatus Cloacimonadota bacterium]